MTDAKAIARERAEEAAAVLCARMREAGFQRGDCNGRSVVCGFCFWTIEAVAAALQEPEA
jgi:hypothetical protein